MCRVAPGLAWLQPNPGKWSPLLEASHEEAVGVHGEALIGRREDPPRERRTRRRGARNRTSTRAAVKVPSSRSLEWRATAVGRRSTDFMERRVWILGLRRRASGAGGGASACLLGGCPCHASACANMVARGGSAGWSGVRHETRVSSYKRACCRRRGAELSSPYYAEN